MGQVFEVARREFVTRARTRSFKIVTAVALLLALAIPALVGFFGQRLADDVLDPNVTVRVGVTESAKHLVPLLEAGLPGTNITFELTQLGAITNSQEVDEAAAQVDDRDLEVLVAAANDAVLIEEALHDNLPESHTRESNLEYLLVWRRTVLPRTDQILRALIAQQTTIESAEAHGISEVELSQIFTAPKIGVSYTQANDLTNNLRLSMALAGLFIAFLIPQVLGQYAAMGVVEEKTTRVVEILLSQIKPRSLLAGKTIGFTALGWTQLILIFSGVFAGLMLVDFISIPAGIWRYLPVLAATVFIASLLFVSLFALLGSLATRVEDVSQVMFPATIPLIMGYVISQSLLFSNPGSVVLKVMSFIPLTAPFALPVRVIFDLAQPVEIAVSLGLMVLCLVLIWELAGRLYERSLLQVRSRTTVMQAIRIVIGREKQPS